MMDEDTEQFRGTLPEPRVPVVPDIVAIARDKLRMAAETEHALMVEYLFAALMAPDPASSAVIVGIAIEEMGHLLTVQNLLLALGQETYLGREDDDPSNHEAFGFALRVADTRTIASFVAAEAPAPAALNPFERVELEWIKDHGAVPPRAVLRVGPLYHDLRKIFADKLGAVPVAGARFLDRQAAPEEAWAHGGIGRGLIVQRVTTWDQACEAVRAIAAQGEGYPHGGALSHFARFRGVYRRMRAASLLPARWAAASRPTPLEVRPNLKTLASRFFNARYHLVLYTIYAILERVRDDLARREVISLLLSEMAFVLNPLGVCIRDAAEERGGRRVLPRLWILPDAFEQEPAGLRRQRLTEALAESRALAMELRKTNAVPADLLDAAERLDDKRRRALGLPLPPGAPPAEEARPA
jgi:hypothetical protein